NPPCEVLVVSNLQNSRLIDQVLEIWLRAISGSRFQSLAWLRVLCPVQSVCQVAAGVVAVRATLQRNIGSAAGFRVAHHARRCPRQNRAHVHVTVKALDTELCGGGRNEFLQRNKLGFSS